MKGTVVIQGEKRLTDNFIQLVELMAKLRGPDGCPWDREQTSLSLKPFLLEECYEVVEALDESSPEKIKEELGDVLFQVIFHARIAEEKGEFTIRDVIAGAVEKTLISMVHLLQNRVDATIDEVVKTKNPPLRR